MLDTYANRGHDGYIVVVVTDKMDFTAKISNNRFVEWRTPLCHRKVHVERTPQDLILSVARELVNDHLAIVLVNDNVTAMDLADTFKGVMTSMDMDAHVLVTSQAALPTSVLRKIADSKRFPMTCSSCLPERAKVVLADREVTNDKSFDKHC